MASDTLFIKTKVHSIELTHEQTIAIAEILKINADDAMTVLLEAHTMKATIISIVQDSNAQGEE